MPYDAESGGTMSQINIQYIDTPNVPVGTVITYRLRSYDPYTAATLALNRTITDSDITYYERATSNVRLEEFKP
jgi:hypothetical protein